MAIPAKGVRDIRTLSGKVDQVAVPYRAFMRISCLEMERARRNREKAAAELRIAHLDARLSEIDQEKDVLLGTLGKQDAGQPPTRPAVSRAAPRASTGGFRVRY